MGLLNKTTIFLSDIWDDFISLLFPRLCCACGQPLMRNENVLCTECYVKIPRTGFHNLPDNPVEQLFWGRCRIERAASFSFYNKDSKIRKAIHNLKYKNMAEIGGILGKIYGNELYNSEFLNNIDMIVPVPLHPSKKKIRGYNQSELIARGLSAATGLPVNSNIIKRLKTTPTQTKKSRYDRWVNVDGVFGVTDYNAIRGKHILIVDDVITTGATIEACANELLRGEDVKVSVVSLAVTMN